MRFLLAAFLILVSTSAHADILVGVAGPMTGSIASVGIEMKDGAQLAVDHLNAKGGLLGQKLKLSVQDDACEPKQAVNAANLFVSQKINLAIGNICSGSTVPASDVYHESNILMIAPVGMLNEITARGYESVFRVAVNNRNYGPYIADYVHKELKPQKIIVIANKLAITQELAKTAQNLLEKSGHKTIYYDFTNGESDYTALVTRIKADNPDLVICSCYPKEGGLIVRQARESGLQSKFIGYITLNSVDFLNVAGKYAEDVLVVDYKFDEQNPEFKTILKQAKEKGWIAESYAFLTYASVQVYAAAVERAQSVEAQKLIPVLRREEFTTILGKIKFDNKGDLTSVPLQVKVWRGGKLVPVGVVNPSPAGRG